MSSNNHTITELMDVTPDEMSRSSSTSPIPSEAENEDEIEEEEGFAQIQKALDDPGFFPVTNTAGEGLCNFLLEKLLPSLQLQVKDIRGQGYDNGSDMKGKNQKRILDINPRVFHVPCASHSLNLVVNDALVVKFLGFLYDTRGL
ncbi:uncharacterized protein TNCV_227581 [Trichonephila clavipes]|nr:uncharacterized protein TNCV_227581 [Trichonephila clavipes]